MKNQCCSKASVETCLLLVIGVLWPDKMFNENSRRRTTPGRFDEEAEMAVDRSHTEDERQIRSCLMHAMECCRDLDVDFKKPPTRSFTCRLRAMPDSGVTGNRILVSLFFTV